MSIYRRCLINSQELSLQIGEGGIKRPDFGVKQNDSNLASASLLLCGFRQVEGLLRSLISSVSGNKGVSPEVPQVLHSLPFPSLPSPAPYLPLTHSAPATQAPSLFPQHTRSGAAPAPLHGCALCLELCPPDLPMAGSSSFQPQLKHCLFLSVSKLHYWFYFASYPL